MMRSLHTALRLPVAALFLLAVIGVPLFEHVCGTRGTSELFSSCTMHESRRAEAEQPEVPSCCGGHESSTPVKERIASSGAGIGECCSEVEVTKQVTDSFTAAHSQPIHHISAWAAPLPAVFVHAIPDSPVPASSFCSDPSPPARDGTYILLSSLLI